MEHYEESRIVPFPQESVFKQIDNHQNLSAHMNQSSWMMGGGKMTTEITGNHIRMTGKVLGVDIFLDEVVTKRDPPWVKEWETVGNPKLIVVGKYKMGFYIKPAGNGSQVTLFIDYDLPETNAWLGKIFGKFYAKWCVRQMLDAVKGL